MRFRVLAGGTVLGITDAGADCRRGAAGVVRLPETVRGGREHYAIGSNPEAARLAGVNVERRVMSGFLLSGAIAGFAGALWLARFGTVDASTAKGIELQVVAAAVVGSVAITARVGTIAGATLGALVLGVISIALVVLHISPFWEQAIEGALIVVAIALDTVLARSVAKRMMRETRSWLNPIRIADAPGAKPRCNGSGCLSSCWCFRWRSAGCCRRFS